MTHDETHATAAVAAGTHIGGRDNNEDRVHVDAGLGLYLVADGVGGHLAGEVASRITCEHVADGISRGESLSSAIHGADRAVREAVARGEGREGMASTIVAVHQLGTGVELAWVGDSRAYLWDGEKLSLLTQDHSPVAAMLVAGEITLEEAARHPQKNVIFQALGQSADQVLDVSLRRIDGFPSDSLLLLCSDGLSDVVPVPEIVGHLAGAGSDSLSPVVDALLESAVNLNGRDNISAVLIRPAALDIADSPLPVESVVWSYDRLTGTYVVNTREEAATLPGTLMETVSAESDGNEAHTEISMTGSARSDADTSETVVGTVASGRSLSKGLLFISVVALALLAYLAFRA